MKSLATKFLSILLVSFLFLVFSPNPVLAAGWGESCNDSSECPTDADGQGICFPAADGSGKFCVHQSQLEDGVGDPGITYAAKYWQVPNRDEFSQETFGDETISAADWYLYATTAITDASGILMIQPSTSGSSGNAGAVGAFGSLIAGMTGQPPISTATYIADLGQNLGFVAPAYAQDQGTGFRALEPVLPLWKAFRNIAYFGFVIIFVVIGFMIMFRTKINPQTVVSVQAALPKIVITLLLITFSYAIASFVVDLIYLLIYLAIGTFGAFGIITDIGTAQDDLLGRNLLGIAFKDLIGPFQTGAAGIASDAVNQIVEDIIGNIGAKVATIITGPLAYVIFAVAILIAIFKLFFQLLLAYIGIIFSVIFAPITLLFNALPGNNGFSGWLKGIIANALVFPVTAVMFLIAGALLGGGKLGTNPNIGYAAYDYAETQLPLIGTGLSTDALTALIGIGFLMMMPKVIELIQKMMGIEGGFAGMVGGAMEGLKSPIAFYQGFRERQTQKDQMELSRRQLLDAGGKPRFGAKTWRFGDIFRP